MKKYFSAIFADSVLAWGFSISFAAIVLSLLVSIISFHFLPPFLPLYNKLPWGYARLGTRWEFFIPIGIAIFLFIINIILSKKFYEKAIIIARILAATIFLVSLSVMIFTIQIVLLVR